MTLEYFSFYAQANGVCIAILGILLFHSRKYGTRQEKQIWYDRTLIAHMLYFFSDIGWAAVLSGSLPRTRFLVVLFNFANFILLSLIAFAWFMYMASSIRLQHLNSRQFQRVCLIPMAVFTLGLIVAYAAAPEFWIDRNNELSSWYYPMMVAAPVIYLCSAFVLSMLKARKTEFREDARMIRLIGIYPMAVLGFGLLQTFVLTAPLFCFGCALMMLYFFIQNIQALVSVDALTRLNNRGQINRYMQQNRFRENVKSYAMMIDVNNFKQINDTYGHAEGDKALILVSEVLKQAVARIKPAVFIGRYGGDEFAIFFQCAEEDETPDKSLDTIREMLREKQRDASLLYVLDISAGFDMLRDKDDTMEECLVRADQILYRNKRAAKIGR